RSRLRMDLPRWFGFFGGVARIVAADLLVFSSGHAQLALRESACRANRIFHFSDRAAVAGGGAGCCGSVAHFQQCELVARECSNRIRPMVRAASGKSL